MIRDLLHTIKGHAKRKALVLMYHRVATLETDVWRLAVNPEHFEQHLKILRKNWRVIPLAELVADLINHKLRKNTIALTFDDGYVDNFLVARPLLEMHQLPATFFISSGNIGRQKEFWWDELEFIFLSAEELPQTFVMKMEGTEINHDLGSERHLTHDLRKVHTRWKAYVQETSTLRCALFLKLWDVLKPLPHQAQQDYLHQIKSWAGIASTPRPSYHSMTLEQLQQLGNSHLFQIGAHTVTHPDLACLCQQAQQVEILENKGFLEKALGKAVNLLAYPYGSHNEDTVAATAKANFTAAVTTNGCPITAAADRFSLGRFLVDDWNSKQLDWYLKTWLKTLT